ncbi:hypothetical protein JHK87_055677 [Glycine soja]|nr:hypothetical protein JHK87_055677 [Glycine soja]
MNFAKLASSRNKEFSSQETRLGEYISWDFGIGCIDYKVGKGRDGKGLKAIFEEVKSPATRLGELACRTGEFQGDELAWVSQSSLRRVTFLQLEDIYLLSGRWKLCTASGSHGGQPWKLYLVVAEMKEGFSRDRTSSTTVGGYSQNQSQGIELDVQRKEGCATTKVCGNGYGSHGRRPWTLNESTKCYEAKPETGIKTLAFEA